MTINLNLLSEILESSEELSNQLQRLQQQMDWNTDENLAIDQFRIDLSVFTLTLDGIFHRYDNNIVEVKSVRSISRATDHLGSIPVAPLIFSGTKEKTR